MAHFLTDGKSAPKGEGLKATPALAQEFLDAFLRRSWWRELLESRKRR